ncbi:Ras GTPase-activating protein [Elysia marginata]|uniref:Ras GTPase-activating protein n=1 Tax=Elysia marginata TaxID=1093978 RepID=A0AAV4IH79_9GAST|nr:Ras GTPase-activating protein [Elysia marginata]
MTLLGGPHSVYYCREFRTPCGIIAHWLLLAGRKSCVTRTLAELKIKLVKIDSPFYNAEFKGEIPKKFRHLSVYVYDVSNRNNKVLGKVSLKKEELYKFHQKDHWFPLTQQDGDTEVQGKVQVEVRLGEVLTPDNTTHRLAVR